MGVQVPHGHGGATAALAFAAFAQVFDERRRHLDLNVRVGAGVFVALELHDVKFSGFELHAAESSHLKSRASNPASLSSTA